MAMLGRSQKTRGSYNQPFKGHYRASNPQSSNNIESSYFSSPPELEHKYRHEQPTSQVHSHPGFDDSNDIPLDAFDKQLLAELPQEAQSIIPPPRDRVSLPQPRTGQAGHHQYEHAFRNDLHDLVEPSLDDPSLAPASSPTVAALRNRRSHLPHSQTGRTSQASTLLQKHSEPTFHESGSSSELQKRTLGYNVDEFPSQKKRILASHSQEARYLPVGGRPVRRGVELVPRSDLPDKLRTVFRHEVFNAVQSNCFPTAFQSDSNLVVSAPTGSGKTAIMELAICRLVATCKAADFKIVYQAPTKALCSERHHDWDAKFKLLGLQCAELTGDTEYDHLRKVQQANIIITTPEKWDSVTRKWRDNIKLVEMIKLFLVDEVHMLKDQRGATLEAVISRMKSMGTDVRFVALSATIPNSEDIATWLGKDAATRDEPAVRKVFDETFRPVPLVKHVFGFKCNGNDFAFDNMVRSEIPNYIVGYGKRKPTMVFCMTRKSAQQTASLLAEFFGSAGKSQLPWSQPITPVAVGDTGLRKIVHTGVAYHHGGLSPADRTSVEKGFMDGNISILCSTSTLAVGVNLPCYLVILQGTSTWTGAGAQSYSDLEVMQMLGRAGRPQYETSACAVILTREHQASRYQDLVTGNETLESTLHRNLIEHLNAEIGLGTIHDRESAQRWLASTFLKVRIARNPAHYRLEEFSEGTDSDVLLRELCDKDMDLLQEADIIAGEDRVKCTAVGEAMARYLVKFDTMKTFAAIPPRAKLSDILGALVQAEEFSEVRLRAGEKLFYKDLNKHNDIMFPINIDISSTAHKVSLILQAELGAVSLPDSDAHKKHYQQYGIEKNIAFQHAKRLIRCIVDCQLHMKDSTSVKNALELGRSLAARAWDRTPRQLKQLPDIGDVSVRKLAARGIQSIETLFSSEPHQIEMALGRPPTFGNKLLKKLDAYPVLRVSVKEQGRSMKPGKGADLKLLCQIGFLNEKVPAAFNQTQVYVCFLVEDSNGNVIDFRRFSGAKVGLGEDIMLTAHLDVPAASIRCHVMCDEILGTARFADLEVKNIPINIFPTNNAVAKRAYGTSGRVHHVKGKDEFPDDGVEDEDFLAVSKRGEIDVVDDIDEVLLAAERDDNSPVKKISQKPSKTGAEDFSQWKEPQQLPNGNWTCQHNCVDKGLDCKHKCCHEGVTRPKKKPTKLAKGDTGDNKQPKITSMAGMSNISAKRAAPKANDNIDDGQAVAEGQAETDIVDDIMQNFRASKPSVRPVASQQELSADRPRKIRAPQDVAAASNDVSADQSQTRYSADAIFDVDEDAFDAMDCDWPSLGRTNVADDFDYEIPGDDGSTIPLASHTTHAIAAPHSHVSLQDVQMQPDPDFRRPRQDSSPGRALSSPVIQRHSLEDLDAFGHVFDDEPGFDIEDAFTPTTINVATPEMGDAFSDSFLDNETGVEALKPTTKAIGQETEQEKAQRLWKEDQMRRWAKLPAWMYDEYGDVAELVD